MEFFFWKWAPVQCIWNTILPVYNIYPRYDSIWLETIGNTFHQRGTPLDYHCWDYSPIIHDHWKRIATEQHHDDVIKWIHFLRCLPFVRGIHRSPVNSPHKGQWRGALICARINGWVNNREAGDLRRHRAHYDVIVMMLDTTERNCQAAVTLENDMVLIQWSRSWLLGHHHQIIAGDEGMNNVNMWLWFHWFRILASSNIASYDSEDVQLLTW